MARTLLFLWILVPVTGKWCNVDGSKCRGRWNELERFFPLNLANDWYGFSYPVDWDGDGRVDVIDVIHAETNYARVPDGPHGTVMDGKRRRITFLYLQFVNVLTCKMIQERDSDYHGLVFCTNSGVLGHGSGMDTALQVAQRLTTLRLEDASASSAEDKEMIDARVRSSSGGFEATNGFVRMALREASEQAQGSFENDLSKVGALAAHQNHPY
ncbi:Uncharacterized protein SCF082_LOCUS28543 [Durusdinium trenchii]|uniref:Uncharacterized protein n=1 Tax=Durusdinium trenchii TaxID=1381693 RepID=A0ABP0MKY1_9DINO